MNLNIDTWANPGYLWLLLIIPLLTAWYWYRLKNSNPELRFSGLSLFAGMPKSPKTWLVHGLFVLAQ